MPHELNDNPKIVVLRCLLRSFCVTKTTHFSSGLWLVRRSVSSPTTGDVRHRGWMLEKLHNTSRSRNCTKNRLWWLFGGLRSVSSITASWIRAKRLRRRSTADKLMKCTRSPNWSIWSDQFSSMTMLARMLLNWPCRSWMNWATRLCLICHIHRTSRPPIITFFKYLDNFLREKCFKSRDDAESAFNDFIASRTPDFYANGINKLVSRWQKMCQF